MPAIWTFRVVVLLIAVFVGGISSANLVAEFLRPTPPPFPSASNPPKPEQVSAAIPATIAPFRSDLVADHALALAGQAFKSEIRGEAESLKTIDGVTRSALKIGPHDARMWLLLALVQARTNPADPLIVESLKMSYLTGPNRTEIIPIRLRAVTANNALSDSDLGEFARGDVRAVLSRLRDQRPALASDYARASDIGRKFLEESVAAIDPGSVNLLRNK